MKITEKHLQSLIARVEYHRVPDSTVTIASLILHNGFAVNGESACINPADFDEKIGQEIAYKNAFEQLWKLEGYRIKAESEPLEQTWQGRLLLEYHQLQSRTEKLYQFLSANPEHEAAEILSGQYHLMRQYLDVLKYRVGDMGETTHALPPALEPFDKDVMFIKVNNNTIYALETSYIKTLLSWHEDTAQITRLFADEEFPTGTNGERKDLAEILLIQKDKWKQHRHQCWDGRPMRICCIDEDE